MTKCKRAGSFHDLLVAIMHKLVIEKPYPVYPDSIGDLSEYVALHPAPHNMLRPGRAIQF